MKKKFTMTQKAADVTLASIVRCEEALKVGNFGGVICPLCDVFNCGKCPAQRYFGVHCILVESPAGFRARQEWRIRQGYKMLADAGYDVKEY